MLITGDSEQRVTTAGLKAAQLVVLCFFNLYSHRSSINASNSSAFRPSGRRARRHTRYRRLWISTDQSECYTVWEGTDNFTVSQSICKLLSGQLASIHNAHDNEKVRKRSVASSWLGAQRNANGQWKWSDGSAVDFANWAAGEPSNAALKRCLRMDSATGLWAARHCGEIANCVCEVPLTQSAATKSPHRCPNGGLCKFHNGHGFKRSDQLFTTWEDAEEFCSFDLNGHLASIHDNVTEALIGDFFGDSIAEAWLGGQFKQPEPVWSDGSTWDYVNYVKTHRRMRESNGEGAFCLQFLNAGNVEKGWAWSDCNIAPDVGITAICKFSV